MIFGQDTDTKYEKALRKIGIDLGMLSSEVRPRLILFRCNLEGAQAARLVDEQIARGIGRHRLAERKALRVFAAKLVKLDRIGIGFSAFRDHFHPEIVCKRNN